MVSNTMTTLTGFDPSVVSNSITAVKGAYEKLIAALGDEAQREFVSAMASKWACNEAQTFFNTAFKPAIDGLIKSSNTIFESVVSSMNSAGQAWATETSSTYSGQTFSAINKEIDTSVILENIDGVRGIDVVEANNIAAKLAVIAGNAQQALTEAQQAVQNCGFIGGNQANNLIASLGTIKSKIDASTQEITTTAKDAINKTVERYERTKSNVEVAFSEE